MPPSEAVMVQLSSFGGMMILVDMSIAIQAVCVKFVMHGGPVVLHNIWYWARVKIVVTAVAEERHILRFLEPYVNSIVGVMIPVCDVQTSTAGSCLGRQHYPILILSKK